MNIGNVGREQAVREPGIAVAASVWQRRGEPGEGWPDRNWHPTSGELNWLEELDPRLGDEEE